MLFISLQELFSFTRYLNFCFEPFGSAAQWLDLKNKVNFKIHDFKAWLTIVINILPNTTRSNNNQIMTIFQLIDYDKRCFS